MLKIIKLLALSFALILMAGQISCNKDETPINAPVITILGSNPTIQCVGVAYIDAGATATDVEDGDLTSGIISEINVSVGAVGGGNVKYTVTDSDGHTTTATRTIDVIYCK